MHKQYENKAYHVARGIVWERFALDAHKHFNEKSALEAHVVELGRAIIRQDLTENLTSEEFALWWNAHPSPEGVSAHTEGIVSANDASPVAALESGQDAPSRTCEEGIVDEKIQVLPQERAHTLVFLPSPYPNGADCYLFHSGGRWHDPVSAAIEKRLGFEAVRPAKEEYYRLLLGGHLPSNVGEFIEFCPRTGYVWKKGAGAKDPCWQVEPKSSSPQGYHPYEDEGFDEIPF